MIRKKLGDFYQIYGFMNLKKLRKVRDVCVALWKEYFGEPRKPMLKRKTKKSM